MILFDIKCNDGHVFEAWFQNNEAFERQAKSELVECPLCGCTKVSKSLMSPNISSNNSAKRGSDDFDADHKAGEHENHKVMVSAHSTSTNDVSSEDVKRAIEHMHNTMAKFRRQVEKSCEYVGNNFAEEARKIHYGEGEKRGIYGETTVRETEELIKEGIDLLPVPGTDKLDS